MEPITGPDAVSPLVELIMTWGSRLVILAVILAAVTLAVKMSGGSNHQPQQSDDSDDE